MSIRTYGIFNTNSSSGNKGYPTADVSNIILRSLSGLRAGIRWTDPENTMVDNAVLSEWYSTIIIRKDGSVPESIEDGVLVIESTIRNQYQEIEYIDQNGLEDGHTYYYRFFTKSTTGVIGDGSATVKMTAKKVSPVLAENDWATIIEVAESGAAPETWNIGDEIDITLGGSFAGTYTMQIWDFNHFDKADGSGKAAITFGSKGTVPLSGDIYNISKDGWVDTPIFSEIQGIYNLLPDEIRVGVKEVQVPYHIAVDGIAGLYFDQINTTSCQVFTPSHTELGGTHNDMIACGSQFPFFTDNGSRIKNNNSGDDVTVYYTRSMRYTYNIILYIDRSGMIQSVAPNDTLGTKPYPTCFLFNI